ncbi:MAG TPA: hypothetical protein VFN67_21620 [Polyangiales bacterium]|jgi:hypothetical protein|nr:hypothetical protein [Polyangiales bacterium]
MVPLSKAQTQGALVPLSGETGIVSFYGFENITIIVWHAKPTLAAAQHLSRVSIRRRVEFENGISVIHLVQGTFEMPDASTRDAFAKLLRDGGGKLAVLCVIVGTGGFWASALRSLITGLRVVSRGTFDSGLYKDVREAVDYLVPRHLTQTGVPIDVDQLTDVLTTLLTAPV